MPSDPIAQQSAVATRSASPPQSGRLHWLRQPPARHWSCTRHRVSQRWCSKGFQRVAELLAQVGLPRDAGQRYPHAFSGGQRQRIVIARALSLNPRLIIADEATSALDVTLRGQILDLLLELQRSLGLSFVLISHDLGVIRYFCNRIAVMYRGEIVEIGAADDICFKPRQPYTQALLAAVPEADPRRRNLLHAA